ncbi:putative bifunctional nitrilase/nitrile hydratase NIT4B-like [Capsicum annuum]|nr:putative bifunctional nitrilase/nitrile hydratase NIT4B-like [Capsicum annuum]
MIRQNWNVQECNNKVRKRGGGSSSSSSSLVQRYRLKRAVLVGKRGGGGGIGTSNSTTPVPLWKMKSRSPSLKNDNGNSSRKLFKNLQQQQQQQQQQDLSVSARKLGATLWEINGVVLPIPKKEENFLKSSAKFGAVGLELSDPSQISPVTERMERSKEDSHRRRTNTIGSHRILQTDFSFQNGCLIEVDQTQNRGSSVNKHRLKDVKNGLSASKELLKVLHRVWSVEEHQATCLSLFSAMKAELDRSCIQVTKLIHEQRYNNQHGEFDVMLRQFEEEKAAWKLKEQDKIHAAITSIAKELKVEKKLRKQTERLNKKLGKELADTKASLLKATKELEGEKRAREILEQVCDELARGIGEDRAEVEELKRQSAKVREEVEKEREMLQLADVLREERVQMKLSEAKYQFEEKNAVVDKLRNELEAYLRSKKGQEQRGESPNYEKIKELERHLRETLPSTCYYQDKEKENGEVLDNDDDDQDDDDNDSADSDLHSIELNMDDNTKSYQWCSALQDDPKRSSVSDKSKARRSISEKFQRQTIPIERETSDGIEWEFSAGGGKENMSNMDTFDKGRSNFLENGSVFEFSSQVWRKDCEDEIERYKMIKDLRDHIVSASRKTPSQHGFSSPSKNWSQPSNDAERVINEAFAVLQGAN